MVLPSTTLRVWREGRCRCCFASARWRQNLSRRRICALQTAVFDRVSSKLFQGPQYESRVDARYAEGRIGQESIGQRFVFGKRRGDDPRHIIILAADDLKFDHERMRFQGALKPLARRGG